jgi:NADPH-dependent 2,4-dienoyl-CoA reductase/sulfur reductase-like enzyme
MTPNPAVEPTHAPVCDAGAALADRRSLRRGRFEARSQLTARPLDGQRTTTRLLEDGMATDNLTDETDVLIVGAGPTGLTLACELVRRGVRIPLIEKMDAFPTTSRSWDFRRGRWKRST